MSAQHTPGPWEAFNHSWSDTSIIAPDFEHAICRLDINHATEESQEADEAQMAANARLIAAAPELLEALKITLGNIMSLGPAGALESVPMPFRVWAYVVKNAIDKAEGNV